MFFPQVYHFIFTSNDLHLLFYLPDIQFNKVLWQILSVGAILVTLIYLLVSQQQIAHFFFPHMICEYFEESTLNKGLTNFIMHAF